MTLSLPVYRNSFHPAWLLLLLPPSLGFLSSAYDTEGEGAIALAIRGLLAMAFVGPLVWWRVGEPSSGVCQWLKELRMQLPGCLLAIGVPGILGMIRVPREALEWSQGIFAVGCLVLGATAWGAEFEKGTLGPLLSQPLSRGAIYRQKLAVLGLLLALAWLNFILTVAPGEHGLFSEDRWVTVLIPLTVFCTAPLFALITRSTLAGLIFTVAVPCGLLMMAIVGTALVRRFFFEGGAMEGVWFPHALLAAVAAYLAAGAWLGWVAFRRLEVREAGGSIGPGDFHPLSLPTDRWLGFLLPTGVWGHLLRKEVRLHVVPWLVAGIMVGLWGLGLLARVLLPENEISRGLSHPEIPLVLAACMGILILLVAGSACVAEERQLGTLDWQLTQPVTVERQWWAKILVAVTLGVVFGLALPLVLLRIAYGASLFAGAMEANPVLFPAVYGSGAAALMVIAIYASSCCRSTIKATALAIGIAAGLAGLIALTVFTAGEQMDWILSSLQRRAGTSRLAWAPGVQTLIVGFPLLWLGAATALLGGFLVLARHNFRQTAIPVSQVVRQLTGLGMAAVILGTVLSVVMVFLLALQQLR